MKGKGVRRTAHAFCLLVALATAAAGKLRAAEKLLSDAAIQNAADYSAKERGRSLLIIEHGKVRFEQYLNGADASKPFKIYSGTKAFWNLAALAAAEEGLLRLNEKVADSVPEWRDDPRRSRITIRQLLDFTAGLDPLFDIHEDNLPNRDAMAVRAALVADPGTTFIYGPASIQMMHVVLAKKLASRNETPTHYLERHVLAPLGFGSQRYVPDKSGHPLLAAGFVMTPRAWKKLGVLMLRSGDPIVSSDSFNHFREGTSVNPEFAFGMWNNHLANRRSAREVDVEKMLHEKWQKQDWTNTCLCRDAPEDLLACIGSGGQRLYVVPSRDLIVIRQGNASDLYDATFLRLLFGKPAG